MLSNILMPNRKNWITLRIVRKSLLLFDEGNREGERHNQLKRENDLATHCYRGLDFNIPR